MQKLVYYISLALEGVKNNMPFMLGGGWIMWYS